MHGGRASGPATRNLGLSIEPLTTIVPRSRHKAPQELTACHETYVQKEALAVDQPASCVCCALEALLRRNGFDHLLAERNARVDLALL